MFLFSNPLGHLCTPALSYTIPFNPLTPLVPHPPSCHYPACFILQHLSRPQPLLLCYQQTAQCLYVPHYSSSHCASYLFLSCWSTTPTPKCLPSLLAHYWTLVMPPLLFGNFFHIIEVVHCHILFPSLHSLHLLGCGSCCPIHLRPSSFSSLFTSNPVGSLIPSMLPSEKKAKVKWKKSWTVSKTSNPVMRDRWWECKEGGDSEVRGIAVYLEWWASNNWSNDQNLWELNPWPQESECNDRPPCMKCSTNRAMCIHNSTTSPCPICLLLD